MHGSRRRRARGAGGHHPVPSMAAQGCRDVAVRVRCECSQDQGGPPELQPVINLSHSAHTLCVRVTDTRPAPEGEGAGVRFPPPPPLVHANFKAAVRAQGRAALRPAALRP
ncbi:MAG: hypothetical protein WDW36_003336 [Sanguina aurantia]